MLPKKQKRGKNFKEICNLLKSEVFHERRNAAWDLGGYGPKAVNPLINAYPDEDVVIRRYIVQALGKICTLKAQQFLEQIFTDSEQEIREYIVKGIAYNSKNPKLLLLGIRDEDERVRYFSAGGLQRFNDNTDVFDALGVGLEDSDDDVRVRSCFSLKRLLPLRDVSHRNRIQQKIPRPLRIKIISLLEQLIQDIPTLTWVTRIEDEDERKDKLRQIKKSVYWSLILLSDTEHLKNIISNSDDDDIATIILPICKKTLPIWEKMELDVP